MNDTRPQTRKVVIVRDGFFALSSEVCNKIPALRDDDDVGDWELERDDPDLIAAIESVGVENAGGNNGPNKTCHLKIVEIPSDVRWYVYKGEYDNYELVNEYHRSWS